MSDYKNRVEEAISLGQLWRAKEILQGRLVTTGYDTELFREYGSVLKQMGDLRVAGKFFFLSGFRGPEYDECIKIFRERDCKGPFSAVWANIPKSAQIVTKEELPDVVLSDLTQIGFDPSEIRSVFKAVEKKRLAKEESNRIRASIKDNVVAFSLMLLAGLLFFGFLYQSIVGAIAIIALLRSWIGI